MPQGMQGSYIMYCLVQMNWNPYAIALKKKNKTI